MAYTYKKKMFNLNSDQGSENYDHNQVTCVNLQGKMEHFQINKTITC